MKCLLLATVSMALWLSTNARVVLPSKWDETEITGYHFHTYYFQNNPDSKQKALEFRRQIHAEIEKGLLQECSINHFNTAPIGPHPIGSWETCCNATSLSRGLSWFMQNRANHSVLLHPLTRYEVLDHSERAMFLGPSLFLDLSALEQDIGEAQHCPVYPWHDGGNC